MMHMNQSSDAIRGELEKQFSLSELVTLSSELLGISPDHLTNTSDVPTFARALVDHCEQNDGLEALADAVKLSGRDLGGAIDEALHSNSDPVGQGTKVGQFEIVSKLEDPGSVGTLYAATDKDDRRVSLHILSRRLCQDTSAVQRFLTAQRALRRAKPKGIAQVIDCGRLPDGRAWVAYPSLDGTPLSKRLVGAGLPVKDAAALINRILESLAELHQIGLLHGDLTADNVMVDQQKASLLNTGTYRLLSGGARSNDTLGVMRVFGDARACAPELARGERLSPRSDVYAAGVLFYEMLAGTQPFCATSAFELIAKHLTETPVAPSKTNPSANIRSGLDNAILKALDKDPAKRFSDARAMRSAISEALEHGTNDTTFDKKAFEKAVQAFNKSADDKKLADALEKAGAGKTEKVITALREQVSKATDDVKISLLHRIGRLERSVLGDWLAAKETCLAVREIDNEDEIALQTLENIYRDQGDQEALADILIERAAIADSADKRAVILREVATVFETLGKKQQAFSAWVEAFCDAPEVGHSALRIEAIAGDDQTLWTEALSTCTEAAADPESDGAACALYLQMAKWYAAELQRPDFAANCYQHVLSLEPRNASALAGLSHIYKKSQSWAEYVNLLKQHARGANNPAQARNYLVEAAEIEGEKLGNTDVASTTLKAILDEDPSHAQAATALARLYRTKESWKELIEVLERRSAHATSPDHQVAAMLEAAQVSETRLDDLAGAAGYYERALEVDESTVEALSGLERIYAARGDMPHLLSALEKNLLVAATPRQKVALLLRIALLQEEEFLEVEKAIQRLEIARGIDDENEKVMDALSRLYRKAGRFDDLSELLAERALKATSEATQADVLVERAEVLLNEIGDPEKALETLDDALTLAPQHPSGLKLAAIARTRSGDIEAASAALSKLIKAEKDDARKVELWVEAAKGPLREGNKEQAISFLKHALDLDNTRRDVIEQLRGLYASRGNAHGEIEMLKQLVTLVDGGIERASLLTTLGNMQLKHLQDGPNAQQSYQEAIKSDPTNYNAHQGLADLAATEKRPKDVIRHLEPLTSRMDGVEQSQRFENALKLGLAYFELGMHDKAITAFEQSHRCVEKDDAVNDRRILEHLATTKLTAHDYQAASNGYKELLTKYQGSVTESERGHWLLRQGQADLALDNISEAAPALEQAAEILIGDEEAVSALEQVYEARGDWQLLGQSLEERAARQSDPRLSYQLWKRAGDVRANKERNQQRALSAYQKALEIKPSDRDLLSCMMAQYAEAKDWGRLLRTLESLAGVVTDTTSRGKYFVAAAVVAEKELKDESEAERLYRRALRQAPDALDAVAALGKLLRARQAWLEYAELLQEFLRNLPVGKIPSEKEAALWDELAEIRQTQLDDSAGALTALRKAQGLNPLDRKRAVALGHYYQRNPENYQKEAIALQRSLLTSEPYEVEAYRSLFELLRSQNDVDGAWCVAQNLVVLDSATPEASRYFETHRPTTDDRPPKRTLSSNEWRLHIESTREDRALGELFAALLPIITDSYQNEQMSANLGKAVDFSGSGKDLPAATALSWASKVGGLELPLVYERPNDPAGFSMILSNPLAVGLGKAALSGGPASALRFAAARHLTYHRGGYALREIVTEPAAIRNWVLASIRWAVPNFPVPAGRQLEVDKLVAQLKAHAHNDRSTTLSAAVQRVLNGSPQIDIRRWVHAIDLTADRFGFIACGDLATTVAMIKAGSNDADERHEREAAILQYAISDAYRAIRARLGLHIG